MQAGLKMNKQWQGSISREGVDASSVSMIDETFYKDLWDFTGEREEIFFTLIDNKVFTHFIAVSMYEAGRFLYKKYFNSIDQIKEYHDYGLKFLPEAKKIALDWENKLQPKTDNSSLLAAVEEFARQFKIVNEKFSITPFAAIEAWQQDFNTLVDELITKNHLDNERDAIIASLCQPWQKTALIEIQDKIAAGESAKKLTNEYQFLRSWSAIWYRSIDGEWVRGLAAKKIKDAELHHYTVEEVISLLNANEEQEKFLSLTPYIIFFKDWRDDLRRTHVYAWSYLWDMLAKWFGVEREDLGYLSIREIKDALIRDTLDRGLIAFRKDNPIIVTWSGHGGTMKIVDKDLTYYAEIMESARAKTQETIIKGLIAQKGVAKGVVQIIQGYHDIKKFKAGSILIANTTHPNYLPAMQKASAIVTNEGGMISHAAIVAREVKIPCIVGTKVATSHLKDGDNVIVDADNGIVTKIK